MKTKTYISFFVSDTLHIGQVRLGISPVETEAVHLSSATINLGCTYSLQVLTADTATSESGRQTKKKQQVLDSLKMV